MALVLKDRVKVTTTTTGTGAFAIGGAQFGFQGFSAFANGDTTYYTAVDNTTGAWETGLGTYSTAGPSLARTQVLASSTGSIVDFGPGSKDLFVVYPAGRAVLTDGAVFTGPLSVPSLNGGQLAGMRNKIINGKMEIAQRGASFAAAGNIYTLDRWSLGYTTSSVVTVSQNTDVPSGNEFQSSLGVAVTTADTSIAAGDVFQVAQSIEGFNARDLIGRTFTLSFWVRSSKTGTHCIALTNSGDDRCYVAEYTVNIANAWEFKTITISGGLLTAGTWNWSNGVGLTVRFILACGSTFQTTAGAWQTGQFRATANQVNVLDTVGNIFAITGVQLEVGEVATPFEHRPYGAELALCQRRCWVINGSTLESALIGAGTSLTSTLCYVLVNPPVTFAATPSVTVVGQVEIRGGTVTAAATLSSGPTSSVGPISMAFNSTGLTAGNAYVSRLAANEGNKIIFSCEL